VGRALHVEHRVGDGLAAARELFLQLRLEIDVALDRVIDPVCEGRDDRATDRLEPVLEVESPEARLDQCSEDVSVGGEPLELVRIDFRAALLEQPPSEIESSPDDGAALTRDDVRPDLRQPSFLRVREAVIELLRDGESENAVAQELEPLV
jgi:hypothetical protein